MRIVCLNCLAEFKFDSSRRSWIWVLRQPNGAFATRVADYSRRLERRCPNGCEIDEEILDHPTTVIGFVGESASSKTHLIVSMIYSVMNDPVLAREWSIVPSRRSTKMLAALENTLINRQAIGYTQKRGYLGAPRPENGIGPVGAPRPPRPPGPPVAQQAPAPPAHAWAGWQVRTPILIKFTSLSTRRTVNLAFVDVAGEDVADAEIAAKVSPHLAVADFIWFVVPSTLNKQYLAMMREHAGPANQDSLDNAVEHSQTVGRTKMMIDQIAKLWRSANSYPLELPIEPPRLHVSTIVAKSDLLSLINLPEVGVVAPPPDWAESPYSLNGAGNLYQPGQINYRSDATRSLVRKLFPAVDSTLSIHFPHNRYFPVSAVGCGKRADNTYPVFKPFAAVDPVIHMLDLIEQRRADR
ncbi:hypothetical protein D7D52_34460 [Nocardia yunnanensis]|uniref:Uncharacterized protein n=1 Tax=Nocardia yunnanensis TaxID=2382165 RepID=A0A386ZJN3_9NOCA|nr:hypothetical protein [Nocardia yunnanensis]AYF78082.1 hypothetical protein D7D52_34460 [Nocardia yunnanensis]